MADSHYLARLKARKTDLEDKLQRLNKMDPKLQPDLESAKKQTATGIVQLDTEIKIQSQPANQKS